MSDLEAELQTIDLGDQRLNRRARRVLAKLGAQPQASMPRACGGWDETRAAYRLFEHPNVTAQQVLEPHYRCREQRIRQPPVVVCGQDTSELDDTGKGDMEGLGPLNYETRRGLSLPPTLAVTPQRLCLGVLEAWSWAREPGSLGEDKGPWPIEEKERVRWLEGYQRVCELPEQTPETPLIYVGDREADRYEILAERQRAEQSPSPYAAWLRRAEHDRTLAEGGKLPPRWRGSNLICPRRRDARRAPSSRRYGSRGSPSRRLIALARGCPTSR